MTALEPWARETSREKQWANKIWGVLSCPVWPSKTLWLQEANWANQQKWVTGCREELLRFTRQGSLYSTYFLTPTYQADSENNNNYGPFCRNAFKIENVSNCCVPLVFKSLLLVNYANRSVNMWLKVMQGICHQLRVLHKCLHSKASSNSFNSFEQLRLGSGQSV